MINGKQYSWEDISVAFPQGIMVGITEIEYSDKKENEPQYGKGSSPVGYGEGNYSAEGKAKMLRTEFELLTMALATAGAKTIYSHKPFPITVCYANEDQAIVADVLQGCKITANSNSGKQGDKSVEIEVSFNILGGIVWNGIPANSN